MNHVEVTLYFNELHLKAVQEELAADDLTLEDKLKEHFAFLYDQLVPPEKQLGTPKRRNSWTASSRSIIPTGS